MDSANVRSCHGVIITQTLPMVLLCNSGIMEDVSMAPEVQQVVPTSGEDNSHNFTVTTYSIFEVCI